MKIDWKTAWIYTIHILAGVTLGYILFSCNPGYKSNMMLQKGTVLEYEELNKLNK